MPLSAKKIIEFISHQKKGFTRPDIIQALVDTKITKQKNRSPKSRKSKKTYKSDKDIAQIDIVLYALTSHGFVSKKRGSALFIPELIIEGTVHRTVKEGFIMKTLDGLDLIIRKDSAAMVLQNDNVVSRITDFRRNNFFGTFIKVTQTDAGMFIGKYLRTIRETAIYELIDLPDGINVSVNITESGYKESEITDRKSLYALSLQKKQKSSSSPSATINAIFPLNDESSDLKRIIVKHNLPGPYPALSKDIIIEEKKRKDYKDKFTITIDGASAKDFDDAISIEREDENIRLFVHIADVSAFVKIGEPLDSEAYKRGTSYYPGNSVIPMLPEFLSNDLCSLRQDEERLTLSAELLYNKAGNLLGSSFHRGIIIVDKRLTYDEADSLIDSEGSSNLQIILRDVYELTRTLYEKRVQEGKLELNPGDALLVYDNDKVTDIKYAVSLKSHSLIEECMLSANQEAARLLKTKGVPSLYRVHETVSKEKLETLLSFIRLYGLKVQKSKNAGAMIQNILDAVKGKDHEHVVSLAVLKSMMQAFYGHEPLGHFGLGFTDYTHFTSPIRRYPDLIVHRCIGSLIDGVSFPYSETELAGIGEQSSTLERTAQKAERSMMKLKSCRLMKDKRGEKFACYISGISKYGFYVTLKDKPIEGMVPLRFLTDDYYLVNEDEFTVIGKRYGKRFRLGDSIDVRLTVVDMEKMRIDFEPA